MGTRRRAVDAYDMTLLALTCAIATVWITLLVLFVWRRHIVTTPRAGAVWLAPRAPELRRPATPGAL